MKILFVAGFGPIIDDIDVSRKLYVELLGMPLEEDSDQYFHTTNGIQGVKHFALWPLSQAAESCFGTTEWPRDILAPTAWIEYDVESVSSATQELEEAGYRLLVANKTEPWGQVVTRFLSPEGILTGLTFTPALREA